MALSNFRVTHARDPRLPGQVIVECSGAPLPVLILISSKAIDDYFHRSNLTPEQRDLLIQSNLQSLVPIIENKYDREVAGTYYRNEDVDDPHTILNLTLNDLRIVPGRLTDRVLVHKEIRQRAQEIWEQTGQPPNSDVEIWERAEWEIRRRRNKARRKRAPPSVEQRPAAYTFTRVGDKIDVLPELPVPLDRQLAIDTQQELIRKARELLSRLRNSNSAQRVCDSVQGLLEALSLPFDQLREGVLLSRVRSLEADGAAFDTQEARTELFPDAFAQVTDTVNTARDLLGSFPKVREIEVERVALDLHQRPDALPLIESQANEIATAAQKSGVVTVDAIHALAQNDTAIKAAANAVLRGSLVADKLLVTGNFARVAAAKAWEELSEVGVASWAEVKEKLPKGVGVAALAAPMVALMSLTGAIAGPVIGVAVAVPAWKALSRVYKKMVGDTANAPVQGIARPKILKTPDELLGMVLRAARKRPACETSEFPDLQIVHSSSEPGWVLLGKHRIPPFISHECQLEINRIVNKLKKRYKTNIIPHL